MNPEITFNLPDYQSASGVVDIMSNIMERHFINTDSVEYTDRLSEAFLKTTISNTSKILKDNTGYAVRAEIIG